MLKRLIDIVASAFALCLLALPLSIVIVILKLTGEHEAFYFQERVGYRGKLIKVTKFVTMVKNSPNIGTQDITLKNDPRVLPVGRFLRKTKLNEFPQFWDVLIGNLSLVGWRPLMPKGFADYPVRIQEKIVNVQPGLTGLGSLVFRDEEAIIAKEEHEGGDLRACYRDHIMPYKGELENWYVDHQSIFLDIKILIATVFIVLSPKWRGYTAWFKSLPEPTSNIIREYMGLSIDPPQVGSKLPAKTT